MSDSNPRPGEPLRVALAGAGMISYHHLLAWSRLGRRVAVVAIADPDKAKAEHRAKTFNIPMVFTNVVAMLATEKIDALDVASPRETHAENIELAAARGIDVLCQKPLAPTLALSEALIRSVDGRVRLMVHENWRFRPWYREIKQWIDAGLIGHSLLGNMTLYSSGILPDLSGRRPALERQPFMARETRFLIAEALIHHIDVVRWLMGPLRVVGARATRNIDEVRGETLASIFMENAEGAPVVVTGTMAAPGFPAKTLERFELIGTTASVSLSGTELKLMGPQPRNLTYDFEQSYQASFDHVIAHFVNCLETGAVFETGPLDNLENSPPCRTRLLGRGSPQPRCRSLRRLQMQHIAGLGLSELDTPALLVDLEVMEANIARIVGACRAAGVNWRPHIKGNKNSRDCFAADRSRRHRSYLRQARRGRGNGSRRNPRYSDC